jgi:hypothetical protein
MLRPGSYGVVSAIERIGWDLLVERLSYIPPGLLRKYSPRPEDENYGEQKIDDAHSPIRQVKAWQIC